MNEELEYCHSLSNPLTDCTFSFSHFSSTPSVGMKLLLKLDTFEGDTWKNHCCSFIFCYMLPQLLLRIRWTELGRNDNLNNQTSVYFKAYSFLVRFQNKSAHITPIIIACIRQMSVPFYWVSYFTGTLMVQVQNTEDYFSTVPFVWFCMFTNHSLHDFAVDF